MLVLSHRLISNPLMTNILIFKVPGNAQKDESDEECRLSPDSDLIKLLNKELRKFDPNNGERT